MFQNYRLATELWQTDIWVKDKQNVDAALRLLHPRVRVCLLNFDVNVNVYVYVIDNETKQLQPGYI